MTHSGMTAFRVSEYGLSLFKKGEYALPMFCAGRVSIRKVVVRRSPGKEFTDRALVQAGRLG